MAIRHDIWLFLLLNIVPSRCVLWLIFYHRSRKDAGAKAKPRNERCISIRQSIIAIGNFNILIINDI